MSRLIYASSLLFCVGLLNACCSPKYDSRTLPVKSLSPNLDDRVKIQFGHRKDNSNLSMGTGSVFMWDGNRPMSEQEFCTTVVDSFGSPSFRPELTIVMDKNMDISYREFIRKLAQLQALCGKSIPPNATFTLYFEIAEYTFSSRSPN